MVLHIGSSYGNFSDFGEEDGARFDLCVDSDYACTAADWKSVSGGV